MKRHPWILAGSAIGLLMASAPLGAYPLQGDMTPLRSDARPIIRIQADCPEGAEDCAQGQHRKKRQHRDNDNDEGAAAPRQNERGQRKKQQREAAPVEQQAPEPQAEQPPQGELPKPRKQRQKQAEPAPAQQEQPAEQEQPRREKQAEPQAEQPKPRSQRQKQAEPAPQAQPAPTGEQDNGAKPATRKEKLQDYLNKKKNGEQPSQKHRQPKPQQPESGKPAGDDDSPGQAMPESKPQPGQKTKPAPAAQPDNGQAAQPKSRQEKLRDYLDKKKNGERAGQGQMQPSGKQPQGGQPGEQAQPGGAAPQPRQPDQGKAGGEKPAAGNQANGKPPKPELPADTKPQALPKGMPNAQPLPDNAAPVTDSGKRAGNRHERGGKNERGERPRNQPPEGKPGPLPQSDSAAQDRIRRHDRIESVEAMQGKRIDRDRWRDEWRKRREDRRDRDDGTVVKEVDNRVIVKYGDNIYVDNRGPSRRLERHARDSYVEELPDGFSRYTIVKDDGARVVTIRNADGDIVRRSRIMPDNREVVLYYVPEDDYGNIRRGYVDAGADLPPLVLDIPANQYILDAQSAEPDDYYTYLDAPPVEPVERIYSVDEVVHSARIRDKVRRVDLDTITFDTGSAKIGDNQVDKLEALGDAINRILKDNPAETFLIEGHTDAVGSNESNLVLSDERAQSVAEALTSVFNIPAENLTTQGYGEEYLKIDTESASRENRRVAVRRITPLVAPVASAQ